ncbi:MAG: hypothetical protein IJN42_07425, partial [Clostridia bacterium]|nr:hypothetical protein [Clostridia bacterium]
IDVSYNCFYDNEQISAAQGCLYFTGTTVRTGRLAYNRIENSVAAAKPLTFRNADNFSFIGNYVNVTASVGFWLSGEIADQNKTPGQMKMVIEGNRIISSSTPINPIVQYCDLYEATFRNNHLTGKTPIDFNSKETSTPNKQIVLEGNILEGTTRDVAFWGACQFDPGAIVIKNNTFKCGTIHMEWISTGGMLDMAYNTFLSGPAITANPTPITYPRYNSTGDVLGEMMLESVTLTGVAANGNKTDIVGVLVDNDAKTVTTKDTVESIYDTIEISATAKTNSDGSTVAIKYYSDPGCTNELTGGNVIDYLKKGNNLVYIKLITSLDNYSYKIYTVSFSRDASHEATIRGVNGYEGSVADDRVAITIPTEVTSPNIQLAVSAGASYQIYLDEGLNKPLGGTVINELPAGSSTYYVKVTAEDGVATKKYVMTLTRAPYADTDIVKFNSPEYVTYDEVEGAYLGVYTNTRETVDVDIEVGPRATWGLYEDTTCVKPVDPKGIALKTGDNLFYIKVVSEAGAAEEIHRVILRRETVEASKQILSVTSDAVSSEVGADTVTILLDSNTVNYIPSFNFVGAYWKLFGSYTDGVLGDQVPNNSLKNIEGGKHTYYIQVVAADGSSRVYTLNLERQFADKALLTAVGGGFESYVDRFDFVVTTLVKDEGNFTPSFTISDKATVVVLDDSGVEVSLPINLRQGENNFVIVVTAENGIAKTEYDWIITCIGDDFNALETGVVYDTSWAGEYEIGDVIFVSINGETYKTYYGENAFSNLTQARSTAPIKGGILYVMPGVELDTSFALNGIKLYGPNFAVDPNVGNRYPESFINAKLSMSGSGAAISGFTVSESGWIDIVNKTTNAQVTNNIFVDAAAREEYVVRMPGATAYVNITIKNNFFNVNTDEALIFIKTAGAKIAITNNVFKNAGIGALVDMEKIAQGGSLEIASNTVNAAKSTVLSMDTNADREGYVNVHDNTIKAESAVVMNAARAKEAFALNFYNNKVETSKLAINVSSAPDSFATNFTANENSFASINLSFMVEYKSADVSGLLPMDIERNYYGTATPGLNIFDRTYSYKPYYLDADKTYLSNVIQPTVITVGDRDIIDDGNGIYAIVPESSTELKIAFVPNAVIPADAMGTATVNEKGSAASEQITVNMTAAKTAYATVVSPDGTVTETKEMTLYPQTGNPVYNVYNVVSNVVDGMTVRLIVDHRATTWTPSVATIDALPIDFYADAECTEVLSGAIALTGNKTVVYATVGDYETVTFEIYKKQSSEKAILCIKDAYTFEYTASNTADMTVDNRLAVADFTAEVSEGSWYKVYSDAACTVPVDETKVASTVNTLYYKVTAADGTNKVFEVSIDWIDVVDPTLLSVKNATTLSFEDDVLTVEVDSYDALEGFVAELVTNAGCTYKLYIDETREAVFKNNTVFFSSNYVNVYVTVTSPDEVVTKDYLVVLTRDPGTIKFADQAAIPNWAKEAVEVTKSLGIVTGEKYGDGY